MIINSLSPFPTRCAAREEFQFSSGINVLTLVNESQKRKGKIIKTPAPPCAGLDQETGRILLEGGNVIYRRPWKKARRKKC